MNVTPLNIFWCGLIFAFCVGFMCFLIGLACELAITIGKKMRDE